MSDSSIQTLISEVRTKMHALFKISESIALLDLLTSFAQLVTTNDYVRPDISPDTFAIKTARHPIREVIQHEKYIPNDVYAPQAHKRFQIITGCNMSGKSTYIRSVALLAIMAQIGSFVPAEHATLPIKYSLFARISTDNCIEANVSTFASEMREMSFILRNVEPRSLVIVDELGRGTSTTDGLSIAIAISEALIQSKAHVWFVTHFRDLPRILAERVGVYNLHMHVDISADFSTMKMRYRISEGHEDQKYYGLALAQLVDLPDEVMEVAVAASQQLNAQSEEKKSNAKTVALAKRRKLAVCLKEMLVQARDGDLQGKELLEKLKKMQEEFCVRMAAIEAEYLAAADGNVMAVDTPDDMSAFSGRDISTATNGKSEGHPREENNGSDHATTTTQHYQHPERQHFSFPQHQGTSPVPRSQPQTPLTPIDPSRNSTWLNNNPIFRPMPTDTPTRTTTSRGSIDHPSRQAVRDESEDVSMGSGTLIVSRHQGNEIDDPIYIEDDE